MKKRNENSDTNLKKLYLRKASKEYNYIYNEKSLREESHGELMMRMMRKMFKRIVSIVMALLVILGTAVYGGNVFAEEAQEQADSASVTLSNNYIYLDPTGMVDSGQDGADWNKSDPINNKIAYMGIVGKDKLIPADNGNNFNVCWKWKVKDIIDAGFTKGNKIYFTYTNNWGSEGQNANNSATINGHNYYRTEEYSVYGDIAGTVFAKNGTATNKINNQLVYPLKQLTSYAGKTISFVDMTGTQSVVKVQFSTDGKYDNTDNNYVTKDLDDNKSVSIPQHGLNPFQYMRFVSEDGTTALTDSIDISRAISKGGILYYGIRQDSSQIYSEWSQEKKSETAPSVTKLYFNNFSFKISDEITIQIGDGEQAKVKTDETATNTLSYSISGNNIDKDTIISIKKNGVTYRFYPNGTDNLITYSGSNICIKGTYQAGLPNTNTVYFDATLSKLSYAGDVADNSLPLKDKNIRYHAWNDENDTDNGVLEKLDTYSDGTHTWSDVYKAVLKKPYKYILFYSSNDDNIPGGGANITCNLTIPKDMTNPCFYADTSDDSIYKNTKRSGYWDEIYTVRDPEKEAKQHNSNDDSNDVVDINEGTFTRNASTLYVNSTFYDYYTDYELNGKNRRL